MFNESIIKNYNNENTLLGGAMRSERAYGLSKLAELERGHHVTLPAAFIQALSVASSLQAVLDTVSQWMSQMFAAQRASITLKEGGDTLKVYSISGNKAIPLDFHVPIAQTLVGRAFSTRTLLICDDLATSEELDCVMLRDSGLKTCMDAPLVCGDQCLGTLNIGHDQSHYFTEEQAITLQCIANWVSFNIQLHQQVMELNQLATTDELTGASNRRVFSAKIQQTLSDFHEQHQGFVLGLMDIDHFKQLNDRFGHLAGDQVLKQVVTLTMQQMKGLGHVSRIGGEEFALIVRQSELESAMSVFESLRATLAQYPYEYDGTRMSITVSIGAVAPSAFDLTPESLLKRADQALYEAKAAGRNCVRASTELRQDRAG